MEEAAEPIAAVDFAARRLRRRFAGVGWLKRERSVRRLGVVVVDVITKASWSAYEAEQRLTVGKFAAANGIKYATCLGTGSATNPKASAFSRRYRHLECKVQGKDITVDRQFVVHVRTETTFTPQWLTTKECG